MFKKLAVAALAIALTTGAVETVEARTFTSSWIGQQDGASEGDHTIRISQVRAAGNGTIQIRDFRGNLLGSSRVKPGANRNVLVRIGRNGLRYDVLAVLVVEGEVKDTKRIRVRED